MDEPSKQDPPYHRRVYDPALGDAHARIYAIEEALDQLDIRVRDLEEDKRTAIAVRAALERSSTASWTSAQRIVTLSAAIFGGLGTLVSIWIGIHGGSF